MIKIKYLNATRTAGLARSSSEQAWLRTPIGAAGLAGSGPVARTCWDCHHLRLEQSRWSDCGRAAPCGEHQRLAPGQATQFVPLRTSACSHFARRPDAAVALDTADARLVEKIAEKRAAIERLKAAGQRLAEEIHEMECERMEPKPEPVDAIGPGVEPDATG